MNLDEFHANNGGWLTISGLQASHFAKQAADDFNPIHDPDSKRFCVPGDLLFSLALHYYGLSESMNFRFAGMVGAGRELDFSPRTGSQLDICDDKGKNYLHIERQGQVLNDQAQIASFWQSYVRFSGQNFPHVLVPLLAEQGVMINPQRPLVIYEGMAFHLDSLAFDAVLLKQTGATLKVDGKRGDVELGFDIYSADRQIGSGKKKLVTSGLREYDAQQMDAIVAGYEAKKASYNGL